MQSIDGRAVSGHSQRVPLTGRATLRGAPPPNCDEGVRWRRAQPSADRKLNLTLWWRPGFSEGLYWVKGPNGHQDRIPGAHLVFDLVDLAEELKGRRSRDATAPTRAARLRAGHWRWQQR